MLGQFLRRQSASQGDSYEVDMAEYGGPTKYLGYSYNVNQTYNMAAEYGLKECLGYSYVN